MLEKKDYLYLLEESFPGIKTHIKRCDDIGIPWASKPFLKEINGEVVSHVGLMEYPLYIHGQQYKVGALHAICTKTTHRGKGYSSSLIEEALNWAKDKYDHIVLFSKIPHFYERLSFHIIHEHRFYLKVSSPAGTKSLTPLVSPKDCSLIKRIFNERTPVSNLVCTNDNGIITSFNVLFATYPTFWSLYYSPTLDCIISYVQEDKTLHIYDIIAKKIPSLDELLCHFSSNITDIYFYFSPDRLTNVAVPKQYLHDHEYFMMHGKVPLLDPFTIPPISRC